MKIINKIAKNILLLFEGFIRNISGFSGLFLRNLYYKKRLKYLGKQSKIGIGVVFVVPEKISIGNNVFVDDYVTIIAGDEILFGNKEEKYYRNNKFTGQRGDIIIKNNIHIAPYCLINGFGAGVQIDDDCTLAASVKIYSCTNHHTSFYTDKEVSMSPRSKSRIVSYIKKEVVMEENSFVSVNSVILCCTLGRNSMLKPNSFLTKDYGDGVILLGTPATIEKKR